MYSIKKTIMQRDGISAEEADLMIEAAKHHVLKGADPEDVLLEEFGLEPDYLEDLLYGLT